MKVLVKIDIEAGAADLWKLVRDFGEVGWMKGVSRVELEGEGEGMIRYIHAGGAPPVHEKLVSIDDDAMRLAYTITQNNPLPVGRYDAEVHVVDLGDGRSRLEWGCDAEPVGDAAAAEKRVEGMYGVMVGWVKEAAEA